VSEAVFGVEATCVDQFGRILTVEVKRWNIIAGHTVDMMPIRVVCDVNGVVVMKEGELEMDPHAFKLIGSLTLAEKRFFLKAACGNETCYAINAEPGRMLHDADLMMIYEWLQWQYLSTKVILVKPAVVKMATHFGMNSDEGKGSLLQIREFMMSHEFVVLPVHCDEPLHWTFLVLESNHEIGKVVKVEYYDWCVGMELSAYLAQKLLTLITLREDDVEVKPLKLPKKRNHFLQAWKSNDCGFAGWQALENCYKKARGEGELGVLPTPVPWRKTLKTLLKQLCVQQDKWLVEDASGGKPKHPICIPGHKVEGKKAEALRLKRVDFYGCAKCRWAQSGVGCCVCRPEKFEELAEAKARRARAMAIAIEKALERCRDQGYWPAVPPPADDKGPLKGGSSEGTSFS